MSKLDNQDIFKLIDLYFNERFILYSFQWNAFNQFISDTIKNDISNIEHIISEDICNDKIYRYKIIFDNVGIKPPVDDNGNEEIILPEYCRTRFLTYASKIIANVTQVQEIINCENPELEEKEVNIISKELKVPIAKIPIMVRSDYCSTNLKLDNNNTECKFDPGCYFIVKGSEKVVIGLEKICDNKILCFTKKDSNYPDGLMYTCQINSKNMNYEVYDASYNNIHILSIKMKKDNSLTLSMTQFTDIPIFIIFRALGIITDMEIIEHIIYDINDLDMLNILKISLNKALSDNIKDTDGNYIEIKTQKDAYQYLISKLKGKRYSSTNADVSYNQKIKHLELILMRDLLPHLGVTPDKLIYKAYFLGKMINKLLNTYLGRIEADDRDSFINKRIDLAGHLLSQLFRQYFRKMISDCSKLFKKKNAGNHIKPIEIIKYIKFNTIEQGLTSALMTGTWGSSKKKGVAQVLQRLTYKQFISYLRRIMPPPVDASNSKVISMRLVNNIQYGFIDVVETPDGHKVGIHKHLSLMCSVTTNMEPTSINNIKSILLKLKDKMGNEYVVIHVNIELNKLNKMVHINLNGEWIGVSSNPFELVKELKKLRYMGEINIQTSINFNIKNKSIDIYTDGGRMIRPLLRVEDNKLKLTKEHLESINMNSLNKSYVTRWNEFLNKYPDVIEYVDIEESENLMIAMYPSEVYEAHDSMLNSNINISEGGRGNIINRYDKVYVRYTHCEFHPTMSLGVISSNIPFAEHNQAPRNYYNFAQSRQGMGIYATNYRHRIDLSYLLYHPQRPLVTTRAMRYTHFLDIPAGENMIVAIACYTGYNQEDSIIMNKSSVQRGLAVSTTLKKYSDVITKNSSTGQDDIFMKPDRNKVVGMMDANYYNKLNEKGYVPEETVVTNGDVIIGKVSPIQAGNSISKLYKDESEIYKSTVPGIVDKVYTDIYNSDGYEMYNMSIRSERSAMIGDKFCCYDDTHEILTIKGWKNIKDITLKDKVACLDKYNNLIYDNPIEIQEYEYKGKMYLIESNDVNLCVTPNHRMYVKDKEYKIEKAEDILGKKRYYKKNINNYKSKINNKEWLYILGRWIICYHNKYFPEWIWYLNSYECRILINLLSSYKSVYETSSKIFCDEFQRLCLHAGWYGNITIKDSKYIINIIKKEVEVLVNKENQIDKYIDFKGKVYCCSVKYIGVIYVRRNNIPIWCGNSQHAQKGTVGILLPGSDMPFTESGIQPDVIINPCCLTGDTKICMPHGLSKKIDTFTEQGMEHVLTFNNGIIPSYSLGLESKGIKDTLKLTLIDGKVIECTPDHKFLIQVDNEYIYKEAKDIKVNEDNLVVSVEYPEDIVGDDEKDWSLGEFNMNNKLNREKALAFARILGFLLTDGTIGEYDKELVSHVSMGQIMDIKSVIKDIELLCNKIPKIRSDKQVYIISIPKELAKIIASLDGIVLNRRTTQEASLPEFLLEDRCPKSIIREFLGGYFGGDGHSPYLIDNSFQTVHLSKSICKEYLKSLKANMENIIKLLNKLDVEAYVVRTRDCHKNSEEYRNNPRMQVEIAIKSNLDFHNKIGFRYCIFKTIRICLAASYESYCNNVREQHNKIFELVNEKLNSMVKPNIQKCLDEARNECYGINYRHEYITGVQPINEYYCLLTKTLISNRRKPNRSSKLLNFDYKYFPRAEEYLKMLNCEGWFSKIDGKTNHIIEKDTENIPTWNIKLLSIEDNGQKEVFDIGVAEHHNFIAKGIVIKNCIPSRMTIGQLFECVFSKTAALRGESIDATPFNNIDYNEIIEELKSYGFDEHGYEYLYCGMTGKKILSKIFIGPTFYLRLKHMVQDKIHCLTLDHEVCTEGGWRLLEELNDSIKILTYNIETFITSYEKINKIIRYDNYNGKLYNIEKLGIKITENHRMLVRNKNIDEDKIEYILEKIENIKYPIYFKLYDKDEMIYKEDVIITEVKDIPVMCVTVENETFLVRNSTTKIEVWSGNSRATGPKQRLTRQPPEGRSRDGGLRFGEMERDAMISHGCGQFLKERLVDTSDIYTTWICSKCGLIATKKIDRDIWICNSCSKLQENQNDIPYASKVIMPYAFKLLIQELMAINILPRIKINDKINN